MKKPKIVIFDFDWTIYTGDVWHDNDEYVKGLWMSQFKTEEKYNQMLKRYPDIRTETAGDFIIELYDSGDLNLNDYYKYLNETPFVHSSNKIKTISNEFIERLSKKCHIYIVSQAMETYIHHYMEEYNIEKKYFKDIIGGLDILRGHWNKGDIYKAIAREENIEFDEMLVIGDSERNDLLPAEKLGANTLLFSGDFNQIYRYFTNKKIMSCTKLIKENLDSMFKKETADK